MLTDAHKQVWAEDGVVVVRGVFSASDIADMRGACDDLERRGREFSEDAWLGPTYFNLMRACDPFDPNIGSRPALHGVVRRVTYPYATSPVFDAMRVQARLLEAVSDLLGPDLVQIVNQVNFNHPGIGTGWGWHQDWRFRRQGLADVGVNFVQCLAAIDRSGPENGGFRHVPGSWRLGPMALDKDPATAENFFDASKAVQPVLEPGDVIMFNALTIHGSTANRSTLQRRVFINGYARRSACTHGKPVMVGGQIAPHHASDMEFEKEPAKLPLTSKY